METYFDNHTHTMYSNIRLLDCINKPKDLINKAIENGLSGIAITDHECLSSHMEVNQYSKEIREKYPNFTIALGNEIYLTETRQKNQKYYHFILIAKDAIGHKALRELSSIAWYNIYVDRRLERVPTLKKELESVVNKYKGHLIATTACIGGELGTNLLQYIEAKNKEEKINYYNNIINFLKYCKKLFGEDFYIECAPSEMEDQINVNKKILEISNLFNIKICVGSDAHYLDEKSRTVHKAYLNSKDGEREIDSFYQYARLMTPEECRNHLRKSFNDETIDKIFENSLEIKSKISFYDLSKKQIIPKVQIEINDKVNSSYKELFIKNNQYPTIQFLLNSDNAQERYWICECLNGLKDKKLWNDQYLERIEIEADIIKYIGDKLDDCLFAYFNTFKHYVDLFWNCGSIVGPGRGSATGFLSNYLLGITQLDPIYWELKYWRFLNKERVELPKQ